MRFSRPLALIATVALLVGPGCSRAVTGTPNADRVPVPLTVTEDGFGIIAGFDTAPAKIEIYTEPQCTHCGDLQRTHGDELAYYIAVGNLQVVYRPLTFLDDEYDGYSATVANALFAATEITEFPTTGTQFQRFVEQLWVNQDPGGQPFAADELRRMAADAGLPGPVADRVADGSEAVDLVDMEDHNFEMLFEVDQITTGTPTVYDVNAAEKLDIADTAWLDDLVAS